MVTSPASRYGPIPSSPWARRPSPAQAHPVSGDLADALRAAYSTFLATGDADAVAALCAASAHAGYTHSAIARALGVKKGRVTSWAIQGVVRGSADISISRVPVSAPARLTEEECAKLKGLEGVAYGGIRGALKKNGPVAEARAQYEAVLVRAALAAPSRITWRNN